MSADEEPDEDDFDPGLHYQFGLTLEFSEDGELIDVMLSNVPRKHIPYMFSTTIADVITTTLMDVSMLPELYEDDDDEEEEP